MDIQVNWLSLDVTDSDLEKLSFSRLSVKSLTLSGVVTISMSGLDMSTFMLIIVPCLSLSSELFVSRPSAFSS